MPTKVVIFVDSREQLPLFPGKKTTLLVGDYTTRKLQGKLHIERKSLADLYQTLTSSNARFKRELFRAAWHRIAIPLYIEGTREDFVAKRFPKGDERKFSSTGLEKLIKTFERIYFIEFNWCRNRATCRREVEKRLIREEMALNRKKGLK